VIRALILLAALASLAVAHAADLDGVSIPDTQLVNGSRLVLNGIGLRTYSIFNIHIYVAGLYLERRSDNPEAILHSPETKLLDLHFVHDVDADDARVAWIDGFDKNCRPPCYLDPRDVQRFLAAVTPIQKGDETKLLFTSSGAVVTSNGQLTGRITDPHFAEVILATFIGPAPPTERLKRELLGKRS
jgi:hypothetical protein